VFVQTAFKRAPRRSGRAQAHRRRR